MTIVAFFVLNHLPFLPSLFHDVHVLVSVSSASEDFRIEMLGEIALLSALCMFFKASGKTQALSYQFPFN